MASIRTKKKKLKRQLVELEAEYARMGREPANWLNVFFADALLMDIDLVKRELKQLNANDNERRFI